MLEALIPSTVATMLLSCWSSWSLLQVDGDLGLSAFHDHGLVVGQRQAPIESSHARCGPHGLHARGLLQQFLARRIDPHSTGLPQWPIDRPCAPVALSGNDLAVAIRGKLVHEAVRGGVIGLSRISQGSGDGREQHEEIQFDVLAGLVQIERARHLRLQDLAEAGAGLRQDEVVRNHPGTVKNAGQLLLLIFDAGDDSLDLIEIAGVHLPIAQSTGICAQSVQAALSCRA
jgi:hypothetical protein